MFGASSRFACVTLRHVGNLAKCVGRTPESWLAMQCSHDLWRARQQVDLSRVAKVYLTAA